ncbi:hypothetical protein [Aeoliella sp.]|uniref:hypothetical protein n=1 Tax=Aeoliella sp. TaxID=2795800 RepID=UPI003CCC27AB
MLLTYKSWAGIVSSVLLVMSFQAEAIGQESFELNFEVELLTPNPTPFEDTEVRAQITNFGVGVQAIFEPNVTTTDNSILVDLIYFPPDFGPDGIYLPAAKFIDETISLGKLSPGNYELVVRKQRTESEYSYSSPLNFTVVPEPSTAGFLLGTLACFSLLRHIAVKSQLWRADDVRSPAAG